MQANIKAKKELSSEISCSLEDHALIPFSEKGITSNIIEYHIKKKLKKIITDFFHE